MSDSDFENKLAERLRNSSDELDAATRSRLNQARQRALDELPRSRFRAVASSYWLPAGATAVAAVFAFLLWQQTLAPTGGVEFPQEFVFVEDSTDGVTLELELLLNDEDLEMFEDLEFYAALTDAELGTTG